MGIGPLDLETLCEDFLAAMLEALNTIPNYDASLKGAPDRYFVSPGTPVWDCCEQLAVHVQNVNDADTTPGGLAAGLRHVTGRVNQVRLIGTSTRCVPVGELTAAGEWKPPPAADLQDAAKQLNADNWALWNHLNNLLASEQLLTLCSNVIFDGITAAVPFGGCAGWTVVFRVVLGGYREALGT
jgi:hypothetical protein